MIESNITEEVVSYSLGSWNRTFGGVSAIDIASNVGITNEEAMRALELLVESGRGAINANVELYVITFDTENPKPLMPGKNVTTHIYFPDTDEIENYYYSSGLARDEFPEYKARLHKGAHQLALVYFSEEVLSRYFDHPEFYEIDDSNSGGSIHTKPDTPEGRYLYVRYGKRKQSDGKSTVTAIYKDLYVMSDEEQRYWHAHEIGEFEGVDNDPDFAKFVSRTYDGAFVDFESPLKDLEQAIEEVNSVYEDACLFSRTKNSHLRTPVENTFKSFCDCCSELYKLIGPDSLNKKLMKHFMVTKLGVNEEEFVHKESGRPLSPIQLLCLLENKLKTSNTLSESIKEVGKYRIQADHKVLEEETSDEDYVSNFLTICRELTGSLQSFFSRINEIA
ncbi:MAG: hypothetical protein IBX55_02045 [Methyloprofundus sp.]|nr:hypothetical protein [Methyloprofundus sp.]